MVKTKAALLLLFLALLVCCTERQQGFLLHPETMSIPGSSHGRFVSLAAAGTSLVAAFSERETTTLKFMRFPRGLQNIKVPLCGIQRLGRKLQNGPVLAFPIHVKNIDGVAARGEDMRAEGRREGG